MRARILTAFVMVMLAIGFGCWMSQRRGVAPAINEVTTTENTNATHSVISVGRKSDVRPDVDPNQDTWETESVHASIKQRLLTLSGSLEEGRPNKDLASLVTAEFSARHFGSTASVYRDDHFSVYRPSEPSPSQLEHEFDRFLANQIGDTQIKRCAFKVVGIDNLPSRCRTRVLVEFLGQSESQWQQINATWACVWTIDSPHRIESVEVEQWERVTKSGRQPSFSDITASVLSKVDGYEPQFLRGIDHWAQRLPRIDDMHMYGHHGVAIADINGDGWEDIYVCESGGLPNRVFLGSADGTMIDHSSKSQANWLESTTSALLLDLDGDGDKDLFAATVAAIVVASNNGEGVFQFRKAIFGHPEAHSLAAADVDNDGDLDVYVCNYGDSGQPGTSRGYEAKQPLPYNDANNGGPNALLRNEGNFEFQDVTAQVGLEQNNRRFSLAASWEDFDRDGDADLYVANDFGRNNLYENDGGRFRDIAAAAEVEDMAGGMSVSWGDFNRDGFMDLYIGNMFSAAGNRITFQRQFSDRYQDRTKGLQRMARGNSLFELNATGTFSDVSESMRVAMGRWAWGSQFIDLNNDGWQDIVVANGYFTSEKTDDL